MILQKLLNPNFVNKDLKNQITHKLNQLNEFLKNLNLMIITNILHLLLAKLQENQHLLLIGKQKKHLKKCLIKFKNLLKDIVLKKESISYPILMFYINFFNYQIQTIMLNVFLYSNRDTNSEYKMISGKKYLMIVTGNSIQVYKFVHM